MSKLAQGQSGSSLADIYDVVGSVAAIESIDVDQVKAVHEMGGTIFGERVGAIIARLDSGSIAQNVNIGFSLTLPIVPTRILGLSVFVDVAGRLSDINVSVQSNFRGARQEMPLFIWDAANTHTTRIIDESGAAAEVEFLQPVPGMVQLPTMTFGPTTTQESNVISLRGRTSAFGAGTVDTVALIYMAHAFAEGGLSSYGLPVPGW